MLKSSIKLNKRGIARLPLLLLSVLFFAACNSSEAENTGGVTDQIVPPTQLENRFDEVRAIHDEVMPQRGRLIRLQRNISKAELEKGVTAFAKTRLERADDMMMNWMYADIPLTKLIDSLPENSIYSYLDNREAEILKVSDSMMTSIQFAESILAQ